MTDETPIPGQGELFPVTVQRSVFVDYARPDGQPLTDADFDRLAAMTRSATATEQ